MNAHNKSWIKTGDEAKADHFKEWHKLSGKPPPGQLDDDAALAKLKIWQRTSTTLAANYVSPTGAAILCKQAGASEDLPLVFGHRKILKEINWEKRGFAYHFLKDILYWHHFSTNRSFLLQRSISH